MTRMLLTFGTVCYAVAIATGLLLLYLVTDFVLRRRQVPDVLSKYVLVTGCDSGFGERACQKLDLLGCNVIAACLTDAGLSNIREKCSGRLRAIQMDVTNEDSVRKAVEAVSKILPEGKGLWGLVNNAGISGELGPLEWLDRSSVERLMQVNVIGMFSVVHSFLPLMKRSSDGGRIVNTSSILGRTSAPFSGSYCMSKHAVEALSDALRMELLPYNIKVAIIEPGGHKTPFLDGLSHSIYSAWNKLPESRRQEYGERYLKTVIFLGTKLIPFLGSNDLEPVTDAYRHALLSVWPRRRYIVGLDAHLLHLVSFFPAFFTDALFLLAVRTAAYFT